MAADCYGRRGTFSVGPDSLNRALLSIMLLMKAFHKVQAQMDDRPTDCTSRRRCGESCVRRRVGVSPGARRAVCRVAGLHHDDLRDVRAFEHLGGVAATCLYDNMKVVVTGYDGDDPGAQDVVLGVRHPLRIQPLRGRDGYPENQEIEGIDLGGKVTRPAAARRDLEGQRGRDHPQGRGRHSYNKTRPRQR